MSLPHRHRIPSYAGTPFAVQAWAPSPPQGGPRPSGANRFGAGRRRNRAGGGGSARPGGCKEKLPHGLNALPSGAGPERERDGANFTRCSGATRPGRRYLRCRVNARISPNGTGGTVGKVLQLTIYGGMAISMVISAGVLSHRSNRCPGPLMPPNPRCGGIRVTRPARATEAGRELSDSPWHTPT